MSSPNEEVAKIEKPLKSAELRDLSDRYDRLTSLECKLRQGILLNLYILRLFSRIHPNLYKMSYVIQFNFPNSYFAKIRKRGEYVFFPLNA